MPQLYAETDYDDLRIKWGHFYTIIGYEVVPDIGNFFYTHSYTMQYGEPFTHTGVLASRNINDNWTWYAGIVSGWNEFDLTEGPQFLGGITYTDKDYGSLAFSIVTGDESTVNLAGRRTVRQPHDVQHGVDPQPDQPLDLRAATRLGRAATMPQRCKAPTRPTGTASTSTCSTRSTAAGRPACGSNGSAMKKASWSPACVRATPMVGNFFPGNFYETSLGLNYKPNGNWNIRPEIRYDWFNATSANVGSQNPYDDNSSKRQFLFGLDAIYQC